MGSFENMVKPMSEIGVYLLDISNLIYKELQTYAEALDEITDAVDEAICECFIETARERGLLSYERIIGAPRTELSDELRREMLISLFNVGTNDFTPDGIRRFFDSLDFDCDIIEDPQHFELLILPTGREYSKVEQEYIRARAEAFLPCHLSVTIEFRTVDWDIYDAYNKTFDEWDEPGLSWDQLDRYEGE